MRAIYKYLLFGVLLFALFVFGMLFSADPVSNKLRSSFEQALNGYIAKLAFRASSRTLTAIDKSVIRSSLFIGTSISKLNYPEAVALLNHYVHGEGEDLRLDAAYFKKSDYLKTVISKLGVGVHGPITLNQNEDWRLSLALNPYYLEITELNVKIYHPRIEFAKVDGELVHTIVPIGRLRLKVYDNLVSALEVSPFYVYAEWLR